MYTKFYDNTIETKFIKQLVSNTNVPFISTWKPGDFAIRGMIYLTKDAIWRCNHTGFPDSINAICDTNTHETTLSNDGKTPIGEGVDVAYFTRISPYVFGQEYYNITGRYQSKILGYDADTHFYLGQYLRMMRDIFDLDMMPFYNCYCGETLSGVDFDQYGVYTRSHNSFYKVLSVPVRFGKKYMVAINSELPIELITVVYGRKGLMIDKTNNLNDIDEGVGKSTYRKIQKCNFSHPFMYETKSWHQLYNNYIKGKYGKLEESSDDAKIIDDSKYDQGLGQFEKYLRLLIKIPSNNTSSVVVIEGDYSLGIQKEDMPKNNITITNQSINYTTINSKTTDGSWIRPEIISNNGTNFKTYRYSVQIIDGNIKEGPNSFQSVFYDTSKTEGGSINEVTDWIKEDYMQDKGYTTEEQKGSISFTVNATEVNYKHKYQNILSSPLGLLQLSDGNVYAFSNRLIEYLLQNVINPLDSFSGDISRIQKYSKSQQNKLKNGDTYSGYFTDGVWDDGLREYLLNLVRNTKYLQRKVDLNGYVDKDTEIIITRGQKV